MKNVLIVDDDPMITSVIQQYLNRLGYIAIAANDGETALEIAGKILIHVLIADYRLKAMNGSQLMGHLRLHNPSLPVIFISAFVNEVQVPTNAITAILEKPFQFAELAGVMELMLNGSDTTGNCRTA